MIKLFGEDNGIKEDRNYLLIRDEGGNIKFVSSNIPTEGYIIVKGSIIPEELWLLLENTGFEEKKYELPTDEFLEEVIKHIEILIYPT